MPYNLEICIEDFDLALTAYKKGAKYAEVCSNLDLDGLTPDVGLVERLDFETKLKLNIMIRLRGGNFEYSRHEIDAMKQSIHLFKSSRITGFVFGATKVVTGKTVLDMSTITEIARICHPFPLTIHKAIDVCDDILGECQKLNQISNISYVLTSGGKATAWEGRDMLKAMQIALKPQITVIGAGKVTRQNLAQLAEFTGLSHFHGKNIV